jgi:hypothetical protein
MVRFIYTKTLDVATENGYYINELLEFFTRLDISEIWDDLKNDEYFNPSTLADSLLYNATEIWIDKFRDWCEFSDEENELLSDDELADQVAEYIRVPLEQYYTENWKELQAGYNE